MSRPVGGSVAPAGLARASARSWVAFLSENTIQDYLKSLLAETGTRTRRPLLARAVGR